MYVCVLICMFTICMHCQKRTSDPPELELEVLVSTLLSPDLEF